MSRLSLSHALSLQSPLSVSILRYEQVAAGFDHTVLLRSNRTVVACGRNDYGQCNLASAVPCGRRLPSCAELIEGLLGSFVSEAEHADPQPPGILPEAPLTAAPSLGLPLGNGRFVRAANRSDVPGVQWYRGKEAWKRARGSSRRIHTFYMCVYVYAYTYLYIKWRDLWVVQEFGVHGDVLRGV